MLSLEKIHQDWKSARRSPHFRVTFVLQKELSLISDTKDSSILYCSASVYMSHCCSRMIDAVESKCDQHEDRFHCPDALVNYSEKFNEYGLIVHDGGSSVIGINFCPWCGTELPKSIRDE